MSWSYKKIGSKSCARKELSVVARRIPGMWATCCQAGKLSHLLQYRPAAHCAALWHLTQTAAVKSARCIWLFCVPKCFLDAEFTKLCFTVQLKTGRKSLPPPTPGFTIQTKLYSDNAALYSSQHTSPCVTSLRIATIIDDRGEDCYA